MLGGIVMVALAAASWGTWSLFLRPTGMAATTSTPIMFVIMGLVLLPFAVRAPRPVWDCRTVGLLLLNTACDALNVVTFFGALSVTTVSIAVITHYAAPILIALASPRVEGTRTRGTVPAAFIALAGLVIVLEPWRAPADGAIVGALLGLASAVCYMGNVFVVRRLAGRIGPVRAMSYHSLLAAVVMLPFAVSDLATVTWSGLGLLGAGSITIGAVSGVVFIVGLTRIGAARTAVLTFAEPLVAVAVGILAWGEPLRPVAALGGALVLAAGIHVAKQAR